MKETVAPKAQDEECLWSWYDLDRARAVPCHSLSTFYLLLTSPGTYSLVVSTVNSSQGFATCTAYGPVCDDASLPDSEKGGRLRAEYVVHRKEIRDEIFGLSEEQQKRFWEAITKKAPNLPKSSLAHVLGLSRFL